MKTGHEAQISLFLSQYSSKNGHNDYYVGKNYKMYALMRLRVSTFFHRIVISLTNRCGSHTQK